MPYKNKEDTRAFFREREKRRRVMRRKAGLCVCCKADTGGSRRCRKCSAKQNVARKKRYVSDKAKGICTKCRKKKAEKGVLCIKCHSGLDVEMRKRVTTTWRRKLRVEVMAKYGGKCACCGEKELLFLEIDHIEGNGGKHRKAIGGGARMYMWLKKHGFPKGFQALCRNCNYGRFRNGGICPHKEKP